MKNYSVLVEGRKNNNKFYVTFLIVCENKTQAKKIAIAEGEKKGYQYIHIEEIANMGRHQGNAYGFIKATGKSFFTNDE